MSPLYSFCGNGELLLKDPEEELLSKDSEEELLSKDSEEELLSKDPEEEPAQPCLIGRQGCVGSEIC